MRKFEEIPPVKCPPAKPPYSVPGRKNDKDHTALLWILEYLKQKYPEDKDAIAAMLNVASRE